jgi:hypothetical protein
VRPLCFQGSALGQESAESVWPNKTLLPAKLPQCPISQLEIPTTSLGGLFVGIAETDFFTSLVASVCPPDCQEKILPGAKRQLDLEEGLVLLESQG